MNRESAPPRPRVSVGVPVYNSKAHLAETVRSLLGQTLGDIEVIISDNASTDGTSELCRELARQDARIRYERLDKNIGAPANYNRVLERARAPYFKWASSNDLCEPRFLEACVQALETHPEAVLAYPKTRFFDSVQGIAIEHEDDLALGEADPVLRFRLCDERLSYNNIMNGVIRTASLKSTTLHWQYPSSDLALMPELSLYGTFIEIPERLFLRRIGAGARFGKGTLDLHREYYPRSKFGSSAHAGRQLLQMALGVARAPLTWRQRARLYDYLARRAWWKRGELF